jgi:hypothetical protein
MSSSPDVIYIIRYAEKPLKPPLLLAGDDATVIGADRRPT